MNKRQIINSINKRVRELDDDEMDYINDLLLYFACEPFEAAEKIAEFLGVSYECINDIIFELD